MIGAIIELYAISITSEVLKKEINGLLRLKQKEITNKPIVKNNVTSNDINAGIKIGSKNIFPFPRPKIYPNKVNKSE